MSASEQNGATSLRFAVVTISETATEETDRCGGFLRQRIKRSGHQTVLYRIVPPEAKTVRQGIIKMEGRVDVVLFSGGVGVQPGVVSNALTDLLTHPMPAFASLLSQIQFEDKGPEALHFRPEAGIRGRTLYFSIPADLTVAKEAMDQLILPDLRKRFETLVKHVQSDVS